MGRTFQVWNHVSRNSISPFLGAQKSWLHFITGALQDCIHAKNMWGLTSKFTQVIMRPEGPAD